MRIQYEGTAYSGWQFQPERNTVQGLIEKAVYSITREKVDVAGAGRTDAGVHAIEQTASFDSGTGLDNPTLRRGINAMLPPDIRITDIEDAQEGFHARYSAVRKRYTYVIANMSDIPLFFRNYAWWIRHDLDIEEMKAAAALICGRHDFSSFRGSGCGAKDSVRVIYSIEVEKTEEMRLLFASFKGGFIRITVEAEGFLRHMVRNITGTLAEVGCGRIRAEKVSEIIRMRDRKSAGPSAPARGLFLEKIIYPL